MKIIKFAALAIAFGCSACVNSGGTNTEESVDPKAENKFSGQLALIESAFQKGDSKTACNLQLKLSKDFLIFTFSRSIFAFNIRYLFLSP